MDGCKVLRYLLLIAASLQRVCSEKEMVVYEGNAVKLTCPGFHPTSLPAYHKLYWYKLQEGDVKMRASLATYSEIPNSVKSPTVPLAGNYSQRGLMSTTDGSVTIYAARLSDEGRYKCDFTGGYEGFITLTVNVNPETPVLAGLDNYVPENTDVTLTCTVGRVKPVTGLNIKWIEGNKEYVFSSDSELQRKDLGDGVYAVSHKEVMKFSRSNQGMTIKCDVERTQPRYYVEGDAKTVSITYPFTTKVNLVQSHPRFVHPSDDVTLRCDFIHDGLPAQILGYKWQHFGSPISNSEQTLTLNSVTLADEGNYTCFINNGALWTPDYKATPYFLNIKVPVTRALPPPRVIAEDSGIPEQLIAAYTLLNVTLTCPGVKVKPRHVTWYKQEIKLAEYDAFNDTIYINENIVGRASLSKDMLGSLDLNPVILSDQSSSYRCVYDKHEGYVNLTVYELTIPSKQIADLVPEVRETNSGNSSVFTLACDVPDLEETLDEYHDSNKTYWFIWERYINGTLAQHIAQTEHVLQVTADMIGQYTCKLNSTLGYTLTSQPISVMSTMNSTESGMRLMIILIATILPTVAIIFIIIILKRRESLKEPFTNYRFRQTIKNTIKRRTLEELAGDGQQCDLLQTQTDGYTLRNIYGIIAESNLNCSEHDVEMLRILARGSASIIHLAKSVNLSRVGNGKDVVVKEMQVEGLPYCVKAFYDELKPLLRLPNHNNTIKILGVCAMNDIPMTMLEYAFHGSLQQYLRITRPPDVTYSTPLKHIAGGVTIHDTVESECMYANMGGQDKEFPSEDYLEVDHLSAPSGGQVTISPRELKQLRNFLLDISSGLAFIHSHKILHPELSCKNVLLTADLTCKLTGFLLADDANDRIKYGHHSQRNGRWCAPESLESGVITQLSNVWTFGVLCWEVFSYGAIPYENWSDDEINGAVSDGHQMAQPDRCPIADYTLMIRMWQKRPSMRTKLVVVQRLIQNMLATTTRESRSITYEDV